MTDVTVKSLAAEIQTSVDRLVQQFADAGIPKSADDSVTAQEKQTLLAHLNREHGSTPDKLTLQRKTRSTLNIPGTGGKSKSVQIEVRKTRTFVKRDPQEAERLAAEEQAQREAEEQAQREAEATAKREAELKAEREAAEKAKRDAGEKAKRDAAEKDKVSNQQTDEMTKTAQAEKARRENEAAELKRKAEEEARRKLEEEARRVAEEARRMAEENEKNGVNMNQLKIPAIITSPRLSMRVRQKTTTTAKLKVVVAVLAVQKLRVLRKKVTNTLNQKLTVKKRVQRFAAVKAASVKVPLSSRASRSLLRPLTVTL